MEINNVSSLSQSENHIKGILDDSSIIERETADDDDETNDGPATPATTPTHNDDGDDLALTKSNIITTSTLVITTSQIIEDLNKSCVDLDDLELSDSKTIYDIKSETKENSIEFITAVDAVISSAAGVIMDGNNEDDDEVSQQTVINKTHEEKEDEPDLNDSAYEARNSIDVVIENKEEIEMKQDETGLHKSCVDLNLGMNVFYSKNNFDLKAPKYFKKLNR